jgi:hypothetical protein
MVSSGVLARFMSTWRARGVRFALVYIMEAHALDEWPILDTEQGLYQHTTLDERAAATEFTLTGPHVMHVRHIAL